MRMFKIKLLKILKKVHEQEAGNLHNSNNSGHMFYCLVLKDSRAVQNEYFK